MAGTVLWTGEGLRLAIGTQILLDDAKISIHAGERVALVVERRDDGGFASEYRTGEAICSAGVLQF